MPIYNPGGVALPVAVGSGGTGADLSSTGGSGHVLKQASAGAAVTVAALAAGDIPNLDASKITTGTVATARLASGTADSNSYLRGNNFWAGLNADHLESGKVPMERIYAPMSLVSPSTSYDLHPVDSNTYGQIIIVDSEMSANLVTAIRIKAGVIVNIGAPGGEYVSTSPGAGECQVSISGGYFRITTGSSFSRYVGISSAQVGRV